MVMAIKYQVRSFSFWSGDILLFGNTMCYFLQASHMCTGTHTKYLLAKFSCSSVTTMITKFSSDHNVFEYKWFLFPGSA